MGGVNKRDKKERMERRLLYVKVSVSGIFTKWLLSSPKTRSGRQENMKAHGPIHCTSGWEVQEPSRPRVG
ncbi:hypothetical protein XELAEV_18019881mg [Xenopus laevis]|uniref:Uncharacterized protein n=1 Tax=Xenopus laevis TaxID=8355 RepID=A0A974D8Q1_XENLA|nr:hypothetical protein XELAEV_18019881mg [Xenopus laevis]